MASGRIRTIKPELLEDEKTAGLSDFDFRVFIGLLLVVDDYGNARASAPYLHGQIAWGTSHAPTDLEASLFLLEDVGMITTYRSRGQTYLHVTNWDKHQKVDKPGKPRVPGLGEPESMPERIVVTYLIQIGDDGPIKIGKTIDLAARLKRLQTSVPHKLIVRKTINSNIETQLHKQFAHLKQTGEWFAPGADLLAYIAKNDSSNESRTIREDDANDSSLTGTGTGTGTGIGTVDLPPGGEQPPAAPPAPSALTLSGETEKPAKQKKLPLPKPSDPTAEAMGLWRKLWGETYSGSSYVDPPGEFKQLRELVAKASEIAKSSAPNETDGTSKLIAHWFKCYLSDADANGFLREKRHGLRWLVKEITKYGTPWDQEPHSGVFGKPTTEGPTHYACAAHRPLKLKPEPVPPTLAEIEAADALVREMR